MIPLDIVKCGSGQGKEQREGEFIELVGRYISFKFLVKLDFVHISIYPSRRGQIFSYQRLQSLFSKRSWSLQSRG